MTEEDKPETVPLTVADVVGIKPIEEMTKEELIDEMQRVNRVHLFTQDVDNLRVGVLEARVKVYRDGLLKRIKVRDAGVFGYTKEEDDD